MDAEVLESAGAGTLRDEVLAALTPPEPEEIVVAEAPDSVPLSALDRAALAESVGDHEAAVVFFRVALRETPEDSSAWRAYADLLQYQLEDLEAARGSLLRLEALAPEDDGLQYRLAQLEVWTGRNEEAAARLEGLLERWAGAVPRVTISDSARYGPVDVAEAQALLGDLQRWKGDRSLAGETYLAALEGDPDNERALVGLADLEAEAAEEIEDVEGPRFGGDAYTILDSDEFTRLDLGIEGVSVSGKWVWAGRSGTRWLEGLDLLGSLGRHQGWYLGVESARWWRWGTVRTGLHLGLEEIRPTGTDLSYGASLHLSDLGGFRADFRFDHGPAYPLTLTLQSILAEVVQDRFTANLARQLGLRWNLSAAADATRIGYGEAGRPGSEGGYRFETGLSLGRSMTDGLILGFNARALTYTDPSPVHDDLRLFWDPRALFSGGLYAQWQRGVGEKWAFRSRINPSLAFIDERTRRGYRNVPHFSAEAGISHVGERFRASLDGFYYQGRFDGYRAYGLRLSIGMKDWLGKGRNP
jgi:tetratricopeptide (TPR) repeat protein